MKSIFLTLLLVFTLVSCSKEPELPPSDVIMGGGVLLLNEGNFNSGNGSLSFFSYDSMNISNDIYYKINSRPLGDVPNSIIINGDKAYIVVNNSGKIEVINQSTAEHSSTISGLISPRNMAVFNNKAYVTSLYSDSVAIINLLSNSVSGYINIRRSSESIVVCNNKAYVANWAGGHEVMVIDVLNDNVADSIEVGIEPESMVLDRYQDLWVLCNGGWARENFAELDMINTITNRVEKRFEFPTKDDSPSCLQIDGFGQTLYYLENGVRQMDIHAENLPASILINESGSPYYKLAVNPVNSDIFVTDPVDYVQNGYLLCYKNNGAFVAKYSAGVIPGSMCFRLRF
jgi:YVTN family beta-propeller protein